MAHHKWGAFFAKTPLDRNRHKDSRRRVSRIAGFLLLTELSPPVKLAATREKPGGHTSARRIFYVPRTALPLQRPRDKWQFALRSWRPVERAPGRLRYEYCG